MASADELRAIKARVSGPLLAQPDVHLVDVAEIEPGSYALRIGVSSPDAPARFPPDVANSIAGVPVTYVTIEPFEKQ